MAGRPKTVAAVTEYVTKRATEADMADDPLEWVLDQIRSGVSLHKMAKTINREQQMTCNRTNLLRWMEMQAGGPAELQGRLDAAIEEAGAACADIAADVIDALDGRKDGPTREEIQFAKLKADHYQWRATIYDRKRFGAKPDLAVNVNVNMLHLDALRLVHAERDAQEDAQRKAAQRGVAQMEERAEQVAFERHAPRHLPATAGSGVVPAVTMEDLL